MNLRDCLSSHTHREFLTWMEWLDEQWNIPSRTDNYLMQIAAEVRRVLSKKPSRIKIEHFLLKFGIGGNEQTPKMTVEEASRRSKARVMGWLNSVLRGKKNGDGNRN